MVKTYDQDGFRRRAGCVCFRDETETEILLINSLKAPTRWSVPSGGIEPDEEPHDAAVREVKEEAGVTGRLGRCIGVFENAERNQRTTVFALIVTEMLDTWENIELGTKRKWFTKDNVFEDLRPSQIPWLKCALPCKVIYAT